jgi:hypothetical protein
VRKEKEGVEQRFFSQIGEAGGLGIFHMRTSLNLARGKRGK